jgi:raffinose/stachyose/melibiose transport system permease protein
MVRLANTIYRQVHSMKLLEKLIKIFKYIFLGLMIFISIVPLLWGLLSSFKSNSAILSSAFSLPATLAFENYKMAFAYSPLAKYFLNSTTITLFTIIIGLFIFSLSAYIFARFEFKFKNELYSIISLSMLVPSVAIVFPIYLFMTKMRLYNTKIALVIVYLAISMPVVIYIMRSYFLTIPKEIEEAAYIDGSSFCGTFFKIMMPLSKPGLATSAILIFLAAWNDFLYALLLTSGDTARTVPIALTQFISMFGSNYGQLFAASTLIVMPSIVIYLCLQKHIESALIAGAVKG